MADQKSAFSICAQCGARFEMGLYHSCPGLIKGTTVLRPPSKLTGGSSPYYSIRITNATSGSDAYTAECNDIIEALGMNFAEGNVFKAVWRMAAQRLGNGKPGTTARYDAEKIAWFGNRLVQLAEMNR